MNQQSGNVQATCGCAEPTRAAKFELLIIDPPFSCFFMTSMANLQPVRTPLTFTASVSVRAVVNVLLSNISESSGCWMPALLNYIHVTVR